MILLARWLAVGLGCAAVALPAQAQSTRTFTNTTSGGINLLTSCALPLVRNFTVTSNFIVGDVDLGVLASHSYRGDIRLTLQSPAGTRQQLVAESGGTFGNNFNVRLNDNGTQRVNTDPDGSNHSAATVPPYQHDFIPDAPLSAFNGQASAGTWRLEICDTFTLLNSGTFLRSDLYLTPQTSSSGTGAIFVVSSTADSGIATLRQAVLDANATPTEADTISFAIPGAGPHTINLINPPPPFLGAGDTIDGTTQPGASCGDLWAGTPPNLLIHLTAGSIGTGLHLEAANLTVRGLSITGFTDKVYIHPSASNVNIQCNFIGLLPNGTRGSGNSPGVSVQARDTVVGGLGPGEGNVISGNTVAVMTLNISTNTAIRGNFIGTNPTGMAAIANERGINHLNGGGTWRDITRNLIAGSTFSEISLDGDDAVSGSNGPILIQRNIIGYDRTQGAKLQASSASAILFASGSISNVLIGGDATQGNVIGALQSGVEINGGANFTIQGNTIIDSGANGVVLNGVNGAIVGGASAGLGNTISGNGASGILLEGATSSIMVRGNTIRNNANHGIRMQDPARAAIISNSIVANGGLGIDLNDDGITANDTGDGDSGANDLLNFPDIAAINILDPNALQYNITLDAPAAAAGYRIEFFVSSSADTSGFGEGERYLGHVDITHAGGAQSYTGTLTTIEPVSIGDIISATTTRRTAGGAWDITSEFSAFVTADGLAELTVAVTTEVFDPTAGNPFATPGNDIALTATVTNVGNGSTDADSIFAVVSIDPSNSFHNAETPVWGGVVAFATGTPALTFTPSTDLRFSDNAAAPVSFAQCTYTPSAGYDSAVRHVCLNPKGALPAIAPEGEFSVQLRARIN